MVVQILISPRPPSDRCHCQKFTTLVVGGPAEAFTNA
ncbi:hypothetical protein CCACVL1_11284 [Corchorus capsularis]|uniref:Uncharacterized protein n=1 Tax=Corchorus capsularis TaxID=210143 RepID=A0A1R3IM54_COCAP|nr:hypothetical protein CCACVL1_11284 [Corchorus capsularis]